MGVYEDLINELHKEGAIRNPLVLEAMRQVKRIQFLPTDQHHRVGDNAALPIGYGQTNSQPYTVAFMLEQLEVEPGMKVLDVGCGSGWTSALLGHIVGPEGQVIGTEIIPELTHSARANTYEYKNVTIKHTEDVLGCPEHAPYDRILVSASSNSIPQALIDQLELGGIMLIPVGQSIWKLTKQSNNEVEQEEFPGFVFVPLV